MSRVFKYDQVILDAEEALLLDNTDFENLRNRVLERVTGPKEEVHYSNLVHELDRQAENIILNAREEAKRIELEAQIKVTKAYEEAIKRGQREGYSQGFNQGIQEGILEGEEQGRKKYENLIEEAQGIKDKYYKKSEELYKLNEENMVLLAIDIAKKIIGNALADNGEVYMELAYRALELVKGRKNFVLKVSSKDYPLIIKNKDLLISKLNGIEDINIVEDPFLEMGSCVIDTGSGIVDSSVTTQMEAIKSVFLELAHAT